MVALFPSSVLAQTHTIPQSDSSNVYGGSLGKSANPSPEAQVAFKLCPQGNRLLICLLATALLHPIPPPEKNPPFSAYPLGQQGIIPQMALGR